MAQPCLLLPPGGHVVHTTTRHGGPPTGTPGPALRLVTWMAPTALAKVTPSEAGPLAASFFLCPPPLQPYPSWPRLKVPPSECLAQQEGGSHTKERQHKGTEYEGRSSGPGSARGRPVCTLVPHIPRACSCASGRLPCAGWCAADHLPPEPALGPSCRPWPSAGSPSLLPPTAHLP